MPALAVIIMCLFLTSCGTVLHFSKKEEITTSKKPHLRLNEINSYAAEDFMQRFPNQVNEQWYKTSYGYLVRFIADNIATDVYYNNHGGFMKNINYYEDGNLPDDIKKMIADKFPDYSVVNCAAIIQDKTSLYQVNIHNDEITKAVEISGNEMEILHEIKNGVIAYR